ncbi:MAG: EAL domain-containing protein [Rhodocyclales bacterium GT-UBC]|nr:MAG: EAL domain-containing protein [Rhodocyclales bacterium GT-UBC]
MGIWQIAATKAREAAHFSAAGLSLLFVAPIGGYLFYQYSQRSDELESRAIRHAEIYSQRVELALTQAATATTLIAESLHNTPPSQFSRLAGSILKLVSPASLLEISPDGKPSLVQTSKSEQPIDQLKAVLASSGIWPNPVPSGEPLISIRGQQLMISQSLINRSPEGRTHFWGHIGIALHFPALAEATQLPELISEGLAIRVQYLSNGHATGTVLFDTIPAQGAVLARRETRLPGSSQFRVEIASASPAWLGIGIPPLLYLILGSLALYAINLHLLRRPNQLEQEVRLRTQLLDDEKRVLKMEIEGRQEAERMLERSHRLLDSIFEHIPGMIVLKRANDRRIARINRSGEDILNRSRQSLIGRSNDEIYGSEQADGFNHSDDEVIHGRGQVDVPLQQITMPGQPARWVKMRKTVLLGDNGAPEYILEFAQDVTEQEMLDLRLREHLHFLEQLIDAIPGPLYFKDTKGRYIGVNSAFEHYIGVQREDISGKTVFDISSPPLAYAHHRADMDLLVAGGNQLYESSVRNADGSEREVIFHKAVFHKTDGDIGGIVGILLDITERKQAEVQVARLNRLLTLLSDTNQAIVRLREPGRLLSVIADLLCRSGKFPIAWIQLDDTEELVISKDCQHPPALIRELADLGTLPKLDDCLYLPAKEVFPGTLGERLAQEGMNAFIALPLQRQGQPLGSIRMLDASLEAFGNNEKQLIDDLAHNIWHALESMQAEAERRQAAEQLELAARVFENSTEGIIITDARNRILLVNKAFSAVTGYQPEEVIGKNPNLLSSGRQDTQFYHEMWSVLQRDGEWRGEIENRRKNGEIYPEWLNISVARQTDGSINNYVAVFSDLTKRKEAENRLTFLSHFDSLTSLPNRVLFHEQLRHAIEHAKNQDAKIALLMFDLDRFKIFNDTMGHGAGDRLLVEAGNRLKACLGPGDILCRLGGDEFAIIATSADGPADATMLANACQRRLRQPIIHEHHEIHLSASIGIGFYPDDADSAESLISSADSAMYAAVEQGGNAFRFFQQDMNARSAERMRLESRLHHALERGELSVFFQPLVCALSGRIAGAEALLRWHTDELGGPISPAVFIPLMEETKLIRPIGAWVLRKACEENLRWQQLTGEELFVAVNLSAIQLSDENLISDIRAILRETGFNPRHLEIELTESAVMQDSEQGIRTLNQIRDLGIKLSIDDFGTGYSSLSYLKQLPLDTLKIDRSFVIDAAVDDDASAIIKAIVAMGHSLQFDIIAEGVENIEQVELLRDVSVDILQGYYFSRPLPARQFEELLQRKHQFKLPARSTDGMPNIRPLPFSLRHR